MTDGQLNLYGEDLFGDPVTPPERNKLAEAFGVPPFTVLNAREGWWQTRKWAWIALGIKSELGRGEQANDRGQSGLARINGGIDVAGPVQARQRGGQPLELQQRDGRLPQPDGGLWQ